MHSAVRIGVDDVPAVARRDAQHVLDARRGMLKILVESDDPVAGRVQNPRDRRRVLAEIPRQMNDCDPFLGPSDLIGNLGRPVDRRVIDQDRFDQA